MALSNELALLFAKSTNDDSKKKDTSSTVYGTTVKYNDKMYVKIDGSELLTPVSSTVDMEEGERVTVNIQNHTATVTGNMSSPAARTDTVKELGNKISEFEIIIADKVSTKELEAESGRIDDLVSENVTIKKSLEVAKADISELEADNVTINEKLTAAEGDISKLSTEKLDAKTADIKYATIEDLAATDLDVYNLNATYGEFAELTIKKLEANDASIKDLEANKLSATDANLKYANIDFSNIGKAAMEYFYAQSGLIKDVTVGDATISGELIGVTIKGDLIEGNTIVAEKLVIKGEDGLYYKLNTDGITTEAEQTEYNSLNGNVILAKSITASKITVEDLVAFGATIGGYNITETSLYSGVKESPTNTTRGVYMDSDGQFAVGDSSNFLRFYKDSDGTYKLDISAVSIRLGASSKSVEEEIDDIRSNAVASVVTQYATSTSSTTAPTSGWSTTAPTWSSGKYLWTRSYITYTDNTTTTTSPVCDSSWDAVNKIQIGGSNLIRNSAELSGSGTGWAWANLTGTGKIKQLLEGSDNIYGMYIERSGLTAEAYTQFQYTHGNTTNRTLNVGDTFTASVWYYCDSSKTPVDGRGISFSIQSFNTSNAQVYGGYGTYIGPNDIVYDKWTRIERTFTITEDTECYVRLIPNLYLNGNVIFTKLQLETGNKATDWSTHPEDNYTRLKVLESMQVGGRNLLLKTTTPFEIEETDDFTSYNKTKQYSYSPIISADPKAFLLSMKDGKALCLSFDVSFPRVYNNASVTGLSYSRVGTAFGFKVTHTDGTVKTWYGTHSGPTTITNKDNANINCLQSLTSTERSIVGHYSGYAILTEVTNLKDFYASPDDYTVEVITPFVECRAYSTGGYIKNLKLEIGTVPTDFTVAPEDIEGDIENAQNSADNAQASADDAQARVAAAELVIDSINTAISMLVTDENGTSLMTQTSDGGWTFSIADLQNAVNNISSGLDTLNKEYGDTESTVAALQQVTNDIGAKVDYVNITTYAANLLINGDFSNGTTNWAATSGVTIKAIDDSTFGHALSMISTNAGSASYRIYYQTSMFTHTANTQYTLTFYAKASAATTLQSNVAGGQSNVKDHSITTSWQKFTTTYTATVGGSLTFWPVEANVTVYLANVELGKIEPCINLGESDSNFKLLITNTRIMFMEGSNTPTYISNKGLVTENIEVENEFRMGSWVWKVRSNGNLGLMWKEVSG